MLDIASHSTAQHSERWRTRRWNSSIRISKKGGAIDSVAVWHAVLPEGRAFYSNSSTQETRYLAVGEHSVAPLYCGERADLARTEPSSGATTNGSKTWKGLPSRPELRPSPLRVVRRLKLLDLIRD